LVVAVWTARQRPHHAAPPATETVAVPADVNVARHVRPRPPLTLPSECDYSHTAIPEQLARLSGRTHHRLRWDRKGELDGDGSSHDAGRSRRALASQGRGAPLPPSRSGKGETDASGTTGSRRDWSTECDWRPGRRRAWHHALRHSDRPEGLHGAWSRRVPRRRAWATRRGGPRVGSGAVRGRRRRRWRLPRPGGRRGSRAPPASSPQARRRRRWRAAAGLPGAPAGRSQAPRASDRRLHGLPRPERHSVTSPADRGDPQPRRARSQGAVPVAATSRSPRSPSLLAPRTRPPPPRPCAP
jgi:hypothetical protein